MIRLLDVSIALLILAALAPLFLMIVLAIKSHDGGPALFAQRRVGHRGAFFRCFKFRTMVVDAQQRLEELLASDPLARAEWARDQKLRDDPRVTWLGRFLRKSSLDELPQLINVIRGEMSLVGPRPIVADEISKYATGFRHYCSVPPGITGLWQVSGRNDVSYRRRVAMDILYARRRCLAANLAIIALTVPAVLLRRGSY